MHHHFKSPATFYAAVLVLSLWTTMLFGLSANQLLTTHYEEAVYSALSLDAVVTPKPAPEAPDPGSSVGGVIAPYSRYLSSATPVMLEFGTDGSERYEIVKDGAAAPCAADSFGSTVGATDSCANKSALVGQKGSAVVINKAAEWANALPGSSWVSFKKGSASNKSGIADGTVVRFTKKIQLETPASSGVVAFMADDNVRVLLNGTKLYGTGLKNRGLIKQPAVITFGALKKGENTFAFEVTQSDRANNKPFGLNAKILLLQAPTTGLSQSVVSGSDAVRLATTLFFSVAPQQELRSVVVTFTREGGSGWVYGGDAITKDFRNLRLVDENTGVVIATIPEITPTAGCSVVGKNATCTFGSQSAAKMAHPIAATGFGQVRGVSVYADVLPTNTTKAMTVKILQGKNNLFKTETKTALDTPPSAAYSISFVPASSPVVPACIDTIDNDGDGKIDADDIGCQNQNIPAANDDNEADDQVVLREAAATRNAARAAALKQIAEAVDAFVKANGNRWVCAAGPLPMASRGITSEKNGYNLATCLVPGYLAQMPVDPGMGTAASAAKYFWNNGESYNTGFNLAYSSTAHKIVFYAFNAESGQQIRYDYSLPVSESPSNPPVTTPATPVPPAVPPALPGGSVGSDSRPVVALPTLTFVANAGQVAKKVSPGATSVDLFKVTFAADTKSDIAIKKLRFTNTVSGGAAGEAFSSYVLFVGTERVGVTPRVTTEGLVTAVEFDLANLVISKGQARTVVLRASVLATGAGVGSRNVFGLAVAGVGAAVKNTAAAVEVRGEAMGPTIEVTPLSLSIGKSASGVLTNRIRTTADDLVTLSITGSTVAATTLQSIKLTFSGSALGAPFQVSLVGPKKEAFPGATAQLCTPEASGVCTVTFTPTLAIDRSKTVSVKVLVDSSNFNNVVGVAETLTLSVLSPSDIVFAKRAVLSGVTSSLVLTQVKYQ